MVSPVKVCGSCGRKLPLTSFYLDSADRFGVRTVCKSCDAERARLWRLANPEKKAEQNRRYWEALKNDPERLEKRQAARRAYDEMTSQARRRRGS